MNKQETLTDVCKDLGITATVTRGCADEEQIRFDREQAAMRQADPYARNSTVAWARDSFAWTVVLAYRGRTLTVAYWTGSGCVVKNTARKSSRDPATVPEVPKAADVLYFLASDARGADQSFEDWCGDYGADTDSRSAFATWQACAAMAPRLLRFLGDRATVERVQNAEH